MLRSRSRLAVMLVVGALLGATPAAAQDARRDEAKPATPPKLTAPPSLLESAAPIYPPEAARQGLTAEVEVVLTIDATGAVTDVQVPNPVGHGFDEASIAAARQYRFKPAEWDGVPGPITVKTKIRFVLTQVEAPAPTTTAAPTTTPAAKPAPRRGPPSHGGDLARPITVSGTALERGVRRKLAGVIVSIAELGVDAVTDDDGRFFFHGVPPGAYTLIAFDPAFDRFRRPLTVGRGEAVDVRLYLRPRGGSPYETVVEGEREVLEVTRRTIERRMMTTVPGTFGDPIRVIQTLPGLARTPFTSGFLLIRGSNPDDSGVFIDGHRIPLLFHFLGGPSILNAEFLEQIELYPGGFPARFGRAIGGIVTVETRAAKSDGIHGAADVDLLDSSAYLRLPVGKHGALALAGRRSYLDLVLGFFLPSTSPGQTLVVVPVYDDYQVRYDHDLGRAGSLSLFLLGSSDTLNVLSNDPADEQAFSLDSAITFKRVIATYRRPIAGGLRLTLSPAWGRDTITFASSVDPRTASFTSLSAIATTLDYRLRIDGRLSPRVYLDSGIDLESRVNHYDLLAPLDFDIRTSDNIDITPERLKRSTDVYGAGLYADLGLDLGRLRLVPSLRFDGYLLAGKPRGSFDPRVTARYAIDRRWVAKAYLGLFHQAPQPEQLDHLFGNPHLGLERAIQTGAGAEWKPRANWSVDGEAYYIVRRDLAELSRAVDRNPTTGELTPRNFENTRIGDTVGLELLVKREVTRNLYGWLSYTLSKTREQPFERAYRPTAFDQRHTLNAVASYRTDHGWELGARFRLATGRPDTPVIGHTLDADAGSYDRLNGANRSIRRKTFQEVDVRAEKTWVFDTWMIGAYLDVQNLFDASNEEATQYDYRFVERAPVTGVPFLPTLGVRGQW